MEPNFGEMHNWTIDTVGEWIESLDYIAEYGQNFVDNGVTGECLMGISMKDLRDDLQIEKYSTRKRLIKEIKEYLRQMSDEVADSSEEDEFDNENRSETEILEDEINSLQRKLHITKSENDQLRVRIAQLEQRAAGDDMQQHAQVPQQIGGQVAHTIPMNNDADTDSDSSSDDSVYEYEQTPIYLETIDEEPWREECVRLQEIVENYKTSLSDAGVDLDQDKLTDPNEEKASDDELEEVVIVDDDDEDEEEEKKIEPGTDEIDVLTHEKNFNEKAVQDLDKNDPVKNVRKTLRKYSRLSILPKDQVKPLLNSNLHKKSPAGLPGMRTWQKRHFKLFSDALCWYKTPTSNEPLGVLPLFAINKIQMPSKKVDRIDIIINSERIISLRCSDEDERKKWGDKLKELVHHSTKNGYRMISGRFWKKKKFKALDKAEKAVEKEMGLLHAEIEELESHKKAKNKAKKENGQQEELKEKEPQSASGEEKKPKKKSKEKEKERKSLSERKKSKGDKRDNRVSIKDSS